MSDGTSISAELINRRLGSGGKSNFYEPDLPESFGGRGDETGLSTGFMVKMLLLFIAVGAGTYFFEGSDLSWYEVKLFVGDLTRFQF